MPLHGVILQKFSPITNNVRNSSHFKNRYLSIFIHFLNSLAYAYLYRVFLDLHAITRLIISHWLDPFVPFSEDFKKSIFKKLKSSSEQNLVQENGLLEPPSKKKRKIDSENFEVLFVSETQAGKQTENHLPITSEDCIENVSFKAEYFL